MKYVYMVQMDWSTSDTDGLETELFENYYDAYACFKKRISDELNPDMSWVGEVFNKNGKVQEDYEFEKTSRPSQQTNLSWHITDKYDYYRHTFIDLIKKELH